MLRILTMTCVGLATCGLTVQAQYFNYQPGRAVDYPHLNYFECEPAFGEICYTRSGTGSNARPGDRITIHLRDKDGNINYKVVYARSGAGAPNNPDKNEDMALNEEVIFYQEND